MEKNKYYQIIDFSLTVLWILMFIASLANLIDINQNPFKAIDVVILGLFTISYIVRFIKAPVKKKFFTSHIFDLLAIIPLQFFNIGFLSNSNGVLRIFNLLEKLGHKKNTILYRNGFIYTLYTTVCIIFVGAGFFSVFEQKSYADSMWWSVVTITTVGYGDIVPETTPGKIVATVTMMFGIGFISMLTSTLTTHFKERKTHAKKEKLHKQEMELKSLHDKIDTLTETIEQLMKKVEK